MFCTCVCLVVTNKFIWFWFDLNCDFTERAEALLLLTMLPVLSFSSYSIFHLNFHSLLPGDKCNWIETLAQCAECNLIVDKGQLRCGWGGNFRPGEVSWQTQHGLWIMPLAACLSIEQDQLRVLQSNSKSKECRFVQRFIMNLISKALRYDPTAMGSLSFTCERTMSAFTP